MPFGVPGGLAGPERALEGESEPGLFVSPEAGFELFSRFVQERRERQGGIICSIGFGAVRF
jgi:hypothetical protein